MIDRHLSKGCKAAIRVPAFEVLLLFISNIKSGIDEQLYLFQNTLNLNPFQGRSGLEGTHDLVHTSPPSAETHCRFLLRSELPVSLQRGAHD